MKTWEELKRTKEFWMERIQNDIFRFVKSYMNENEINQSELAQNLGVSKGYISQILNGNFNFSIKKLIELSLKLNIAPDIDFKPLNQFIQKEMQRVEGIERGKQDLTITEITTKLGVSVKTSWEEKPEILNEKSINSFKEITSSSNLDSGKIIKLRIEQLDIKDAG